MEEQYNCPVCESKSSIFPTKLVGVEVYICQTCGFQANKGLTEGTELDKSIFESQPELLKDLRHVDENGLVWYPSIFQEPNKAMLFPDGKNAEEWGWRVADFIPVTKKDKTIPGQTHKLNLNDSTLFPPLMFSGALYLYSVLTKSESNEV